MFIDDIEAFCRSLKKKQETLQNELMGRDLYMWMGIGQCYRWYLENEGKVKSGKQKDSFAISQADIHNLCRGGKVAEIQGMCMI